MGIPNLGQLGPIEFAGGDGIGPPAFRFVEGDAACAVFGVSTKGVGGVPVPLAGLVRLKGHLGFGVLGTMQPVFDCIDVGELGDTGQLGVGSATGFFAHSTCEHDEAEAVGLDVEVCPDDPLHATTFVVVVVGDFVEAATIVEGGDDLIGCEVLEHDSDPFFRRNCQIKQEPPSQRLEGSVWLSPDLGKDLVSEITDLIECVSVTHPILLEVTPSDAGVGGLEDGVDLAPSFPFRHGTEVHVVVSNVGVEGFGDDDCGRLHDCDPFCGTIARSNRSPRARGSRAGVWVSSTYDRSKSGGSCPRSPHCRAR